MPDEHLHQSTRSDDASIVRATNAAEQARDNPAGEAASGRGPAQEVLTLICETCGKDYFFEDEPPPEQMRCDKCGGTVFRAYDSTVGDEVSDDFRDATERDTDTDDPATDVEPGDLMDLKRL
jgi:DNA-directed RNA polymerase subunit RPC12/RpoP